MSQLRVLGRGRLTPSDIAQMNGKGLLLPEKLFPSESVAFGS